MVWCRIVVFQRKKYQRKTPKDMNERKTTTRSGRMEGAVKIEMGIMGAEVIFDSQNRKARKWRMETMRRVYSYGFCQPTNGA